MTVGEALQWRWKTFAELSPVEVYGILKLRSDVFVVEQNCVYGDIDDKDFNAVHLVAKADKSDEIVGYCRAFEPGAEDELAVIGRIVTSAKVRHQGIGKEIVRRAIAYCDERFAPTAGKCPIRIAAQSYLQAFYSGFGFVICGKEYVEDGIPHWPMVRRGAE